MPDYLELHGCRHDILGHYLKAIGLLRVLAKCAAPEHRDPEAEGWWDTTKACFCLRSPKYPTQEKLVEFFAQHYQPTPFFSPWNTGGGLDKLEKLVLSIDRRAIAAFLRKYRILLRRHGLKGGKNRWKDGRLQFDLKNGPIVFPQTKKISVRVFTTGGRQQKQKVSIEWKASTKRAFVRYLQRNMEAIQRVCNVSKPLRDKIASGQYEKDSVTLTIKQNVAALRVPSGIKSLVRTKRSGKKAVIAVLAANPRNSPELNKALGHGRDYFEMFQEDGADERRLLEELRDKTPSVSAEAFDSVFTTRVSERTQDSPLFLNRGDAGQAEIFRTFWVNFLIARENVADSVAHGLFRKSLSSAPVKNGKGTPFFPDAIKAYNIGSGWVTEEYPFNALDYVLAVEGAFAMRGSVGRTLAANSRRFAAFPFVFDAGEELVDDDNEVKGTSSALWFPLWNRPVTFAELSSFITDAQARLPDKDARFSAEFMRALHSQGVDAGFTGWQEFRFKMKVSRVPWVSTGDYVESAFREDATRLNRALHPLDESQFLDQFEIKWKGGKADSKSPHPVGAAINAAMEIAARETTPYHCLDLLCAVFSACRQMAISESFRDTLPGKRARFFRPLPMKPWNDLLNALAAYAPENPHAGAEFRIARAIAAMRGEKQGDGKYSEVLPMLGSLLPLKLGPGGWFLPDKGDRSHQAVWTGTDLCHDLAAVLARRYLDSLDDDRPALLPPHDSLGARLSDVLLFLNSELDNHLIARWIEALSLIGWEFADVDGENSIGCPEDLAIPPEYAALRTLLELECEWQGQDKSKWKKRRSQQPVALLCHRSASTLPLAVTEALRWIAIWGVPNPYNNKAEKPRLAGRDVISPRSFSHSSENPQFPARLAAAVCIPLHWQDRNTLFCAVTLPQAE